MNQISELFPNITYYTIASRLEENEEQIDKTIDNLINNPPPEIKKNNIQSQWNQSNDIIDIASKLKLDKLKVIGNFIEISFFIDKNV